MLSYNFQRILKARGVLRPHSYLIKNGFPDRLATRINQNNVKRMNLDTIERLCLLFKCTPNDLMEWIPDAPFQEDDSQPLKAIRQTNKVVDIIQTLNDVPIDKLADVETFIHETIKNK